MPDGQRRVDAHGVREETMNRIERESDWGYWDTLDGVRLKDGERLRIRFLDGTESEHMIRVDHGTFTYSDQGHQGTGENHRAYVVAVARGESLRQYIHGLEAVRVIDEAAVSAAKAVADAAAMALATTQAKKRAALHDAASRSGPHGVIVADRVSCGSAWAKDQTLDSFVGMLEDFGWRWEPKP